MKVVAIGEAYGRHEHQFKHALVGPSGRELTQEMAIAKLAPALQVKCRNCNQTTEFLDKRCEHCQQFIWPNEFDLIAHWKRLRDADDLHVTNVFNMQPPDNDLGYFFGTEPQTELPSFPRASKKSTGTHLKREHFHHVQRLWTEIKDLEPNLLLLMGNAACWAILGQTGITDLRGTVCWSDRLNRKCLPTFHPAYVLRRLTYRVSNVADLQKAAREQQYPDIRRTERWLTIVQPTIEGIREGYQWLQRPARAYANDIETLRTQISIIGLARTADDALVIPFRDARWEKGKIVDVGRIATSLGYPSNGVNYWPTKDLELEAWRLAIAAEQTDVPKIFQNGLFDLSHMTRMGIFPRRVEHDTMLWFHSKYPELPKSLGYLGSLFANEVAWKQMGHSGSLKRDE